MTYNSGTAAPMKNYVRLNLSASSSSLSSRDGGECNDITGELRTKLQDRDNRIQDLQARLAVLEREKDEIERRSTDLNIQLDRERHSAQQINDAQKSQLLDTENRLHTALLSIDELRKERDVEKQEHDNTKRKLKEALSDISVSKNTVNENTVNQIGAAPDVESLSVRIRELEDERERFLRLVDEHEQTKKSLEAENIELKERLNSQQPPPLMAASPLPAPPPPPPPPPPPLPASTSQPFLKIRKSVSCTDVSGKKEEKPREKTYEQAMEEMMTRIRTGKTLRATPTKQLSTPNDLDDEEESETNRLKQLSNSLRPRQYSVGRLGDDLFKPNLSLRYCTPQQLPSDECVQPLGAPTSMHLSPSKENIDPMLQRATESAVAFKDPPPLRKISAPAGSFSDKPPLRPTGSPFIKSSVVTNDPSSIKQSGVTSTNYSSSFNDISPISQAGANSTSYYGSSSRSTSPRPYGLPTTNPSVPLNDPSPVRQAWAHSSAQFNDPSSTRQAGATSTYPYAAINDPSPAASAPSIVVSPAPRKPVILLKAAEPKVLVWDNEGPRGGPIISTEASMYSPPREVEWGTERNEQVNVCRKGEIGRGTLRNEQADIYKKGEIDRERDGGTEIRSELHKVFRQRGLSIRKDENKK